MQTHGMKCGELRQWPKDLLKKCIQKVQQYQLSQELSKPDSDRHQGYIDNGHKKMERHVQHTIVKVQYKLSTCPTAGS